MTKNKESINLEQLKIIRNRATQLSDKLATTEKVKQDLTLNLINIYKNIVTNFIFNYFTTVYQYGNYFCPTNGD